MLGCTLALIEPGRANAGSAMLAWDAAPGFGVMGYHVYYGGASRTYTNRLSAGNNTSLNISNLTPGGTYFFAVTSYDASGGESPFSSEAVYQVPVAATTQTLFLGPPTMQNGRFSFPVSCPTGVNCAVEASADLITWARVATNLGPFKFEETNTLKSGRRFFRAVTLP